MAWDLSSTHDVEAVGWPAQVQDTIWFIDGERTITIKLPDDRQLSCWFYKARVRRDGRQVKFITLDLESESLEDAYVHAGELVREWKMDRLERLDEWHVRQLRPGADRLKEGCELGGNASPGGVTPSLRVGPSFRPQSPWYISLSLGLLVSAPTTRPAG